MGALTQDVMELLGIAMAWLETMFALNVMIVMNTTPLSIPWEDWVPLMGGASKTLEGLLFPTAMIDAYERTRDIIDGLFPF